ncbi:MAG: hypothetical protein ACREHD_17545 [Pirellulales bacterium]
MKDHHVKELERDIQRILIDEWDPIGVKSCMEAQDEYDGYIGGILGLLVGGVDRVRLADHLRRLEVESMGLHGGNERRLCRVAESLFDLMSRRLR